MENETHIIEHSFERKLNLGAGIRPINGYENHDILELPGIQHVFDLEETPYPLADNSYDEIFSHHCAEHIGNFVPMIFECHRMLKPGGKLIIEVPYVRSMGAIANPFHVGYFDEMTMDIFYSQESCWNIKCDKPLFKLDKISMEFGTLAPLQWLLWKSKIFWCGGCIRYELTALK